MAPVIETTSTRVVIADHDDGTLLRIDGTLDVRSATELRSLLHTIIDTSPGTLLLDLGETHVADATGLGLLLECHRRGKRRGRTMRLVAVSPATERLLRRLGLARQFGAGALHLPLSV